MKGRSQFPSLYGSDVEYSDQLEALIAGERDQLEQSWQKKLETIEKTLEVVAAGRALAKKLGLPNITVIWNVTGYVNTCSFDLAVLGEQLIFERNPWKRRFYARHACVLMYEASKDLPRLLGKNFREALTRLGMGSDLLEAFGQRSKAVGHFFKENQRALKDVRVCCAAHRDTDLNEQLRIVFSIQPTSVLTLAIKLDKELNLLGRLLQCAIDQGNEALSDVSEAR